MGQVLCARTGHLVAPLPSERTFPELGPGLARPPQEGGGAGYRGRAADQVGSRHRAPRRPPHCPYAVCCVSPPSFLYILLTCFY